MYSVHVDPFHSHVSDLKMVTLTKYVEPPKSTVRCRAGSYAIPAYSRPAGPVTAACVHADPFHSHVSAG